MKILIEGFPGSGKTTLVRSLAEHWGPQNCAGFFTEEMRGKTGSRTGFVWRTFDGKSGFLADLEPGSPRVGKYHVLLESFDAMLSDLTAVRLGKILLIDEVGKMECLSNQFRNLLPVWETLSCHRIFTVPARGTPFIEDFKSRNRECIIDLTPRNRQVIFEQIKKAT